MKRTQKNNLFLVTIIILLTILPLTILDAHPNFFPPYDHELRIFIRSNGQIDPPSTPIKKVENTYTFTDKIKGGIAVEKNNIIIDGAGFSLEGNNAGTGIYLKNTNNITIQNVKITNFGYGLYVDQSENNIFQENTFTNCGIKITQNSNYNQILENTLTKGGIHIERSDDSLVYSNKADTLSLLWLNRTDIKNNHIINEKIEQTQTLNINTGLADSNGGLNLDHCDNSYVYGNVVENQITGISIRQSKNLTLTENIMKNNLFFGVRVWGSDLEYYLHNIDTSNTIDGKPIYFLVNTHNFVVPKNAGWIAAINCSNITVEDWISTPNFEGILFVETKNSKIFYSNLTRCHYAIRFDRVTNCTITNNYMADNGYAAFYFEDTINCLATENEVNNNYCFFNIWLYSTNNSFYHNNFVGNWTGSAGDRGCSNYYDNGSEGNFWSGYDSSHGKIYKIDDVNIDNYPFLTQFPVSLNRDVIPVESNPENQSLQTEQELLPLIVIIGIIALGFFVVIITRLANKRKTTI